MWDYVWPPFRDAALLAKTNKKVVLGAKRLPECVLAAAEVGVVVVVLEPELDVESVDDLSPVQPEVEVAEDEERQNRMFGRRAGNSIERVLQRPLAVADVDRGAVGLDRLEVAGVVKQVDVHLIKMFVVIGVLFLAALPTT